MADQHNTYRDIEERKYELENRIRNLVWTVSGDYTLDIRPDTELFQKSPHIAVYDGVKQGGLAKYFDQDAVSMYLLKKVYCHADQTELLNTAQICTEEAVGWRLDAEREGIRRLREKAYNDVLDQDFRKLSGYPLGRLRLALLREKMDGSWKGTREIQEQLESVHALRKVQTTEELIRGMDDLYNRMVDPHFSKSLEEVLAVTAEELTEFSWKDLLQEDAEDASVETVLQKLTDSMTSLEAEEEQNNQESEHSREERAEKKKIIVAGQEEMSRMYSFVERNFGRSYLTPAEQNRRNYQMCRGIHAGCRLYYTDGILNSPVIKNNQYVLAEKICGDNRKKYKEQYTLVNRNIRVLADMLRKALVLRDEDQSVRADHGKIVPSQLWKPGRSEDSRLFIRRMKSDACDFTVDLLLDASGSQRKRQSDVALQAFIISEALSELDIPVRVMSFCTFWNYTVLRRFREYDEDRAANQNVFSFTTSSGNRDGLAVRAIGTDLLQREERNKILIVLSDGKPNDTLLNRPGAENPEPYRGRRAILDTGTEIRNLRRNHVAVLGVFVGDETELQAEKKIFGKDFAYIRSIRGFSNTVGRYLLRQIEDE